MAEINLQDHQRAQVRAKIATAIDNLERADKILSDDQHEQWAHLYLYTVVECLITANTLVLESRAGTAKMVSDFLNGKHNAARS